MGVTITLANTLGQVQDITAAVSEESIDIESILGQGPGVPQASAARTTTFKARTTLGPAAGAIGAGQTLPVILATGNVADSSGHAHNGTFVGTNYAGEPSVVGTDPSALLGGVSVPAAALPLIDGSHDWTLEFWFQGTWVNGGILAQLGDTGSVGSLWVGSTGPGSAINLYRATVGYQIGGGVAPANGVATHIVWTHVASGHVYACYINGVYTNPFITGNFNGMNASTTGGFLGSISDGTSGNPGKYAHFAVYQGALSGTRVSAHYNARGSSASYAAAVAADSPVVYYKLNDYIATQPTLVRQGELIVYDNGGTKIFGGYVSDLEDVTDPHSKQTFTVVTAVDYWQSLDRVGVNLVAVAQTDVQLIQTLMSTYAPWVDVSQVNFAAPAFTFPRIFLRGKSLAKALQYIADCTGYDIWIDPYKRLHYQSPSTLGTAPFSLVDTTPNLTTTFPHKLVKGPQQDDSAIVNRVTFYGGKRPSGDYTQDLSTQANGVNTTFMLAYYPRESSTGKIQVHVNGASLTVGYASGAGAKNLLISQGGICDVLVNPDAQTLTFNTPPAGGATVNATYRYQTPLILTVTDAGSYAYFGAYYDGTITDESVQDTQTALVRCRTLLAEQNYGLLTMTVRCWQPGVTAGMQLSVTNTTRGLSGNYIVQQVKVVPLGAGKFAYDIDLGAWNWHVADILVAGALASAGTDTTFSEQVDVIQVGSAAFTCHVSFAATAASRTTGAYYARSAPVGDGHDAYPGFFTIAS